jgi:RimJ/RimL family protein N-acetyltransferase
MNIPSIVTERLLLRPLDASDFDSFAKMNADPEVVAFLSHGLPVDRKESWKILAWLIGHWELRGYGSWAVEETETKRFIGRVGLFYPEGWPGIEISYVLARPFWGKGYATEAGRVAIIHAFETLGISRVISLIHPNNRGSIKVAEKLGETFEREMEFNGRTILVYGRDNPMTISNLDDVPGIITKDRTRGGTEQNRLGRRVGIFGEGEAAERSFDTDIDRQL